MGSKLIYIDKKKAEIYDVKNIFGFLLLLLHNQPRKRERRKTNVNLCTNLFHVFLLGYFFQWKAVVSQLKFDKIQRNMKPFTLMKHFYICEKVRMKYKIKHETLVTSI